MDHHIVTEREIYNREFYNRHYSCMQMAINEIKDIMQANQGMPLECFDISALTFQHYKMWTDRIEYIKAKQKELQEQLDKEIK